MVQCPPEYDAKDWVSGSVKRPSLKDCYDFGIELKEKEEDRNNNTGRAFYVSKVGGLAEKFTEVRVGDRLFKFQDRDASEYTLKEIEAILKTELEVSFETLHKEAFTKKKGDKKGKKIGTATTPSSKKTPQRNAAKNSPSINPRKQQQTDKERPPNNSDNQHPLGTAQQQQNEKPSKKKPQPKNNNKSTTPRTPGQSSHDKEGRPNTTTPQEKKTNNSKKKPTDTTAAASTNPSRRASAPQPKSKSQNGQQPDNNNNNKGGQQQQQQPLDESSSSPQNKNKKGSKNTTAFSPNLSRQPSDTTRPLDKTNKKDTNKNNNNTVGSPTPSHQGEKPQQQPQKISKKSPINNKNEPNNKNKTTPKQKQRPDNAPASPIPSCPADEPRTNKQRQNQPNDTNNNDNNNNHNKKTTTTPKQNNNKRSPTSKQPKKTTADPSPPPGYNPKAWVSGSLTRPSLKECYDFGLDLKLSDNGDGHYYLTRVEGLAKTFTEARVGDRLFKLQGRDSPGDFSSLKEIQDILKTELHVTFETLHPELL